MCPRAKSLNKLEDGIEMGNPETFWRSYDIAALEHARQDHARTISEAIGRLAHRRSAWCKGYLTYLYDKGILDRRQAKRVMQELNPGNWKHLDIVESRSRRHRVPSCGARDVPFWWA